MMIEQKVVGEFLQDNEGVIETYYLIRTVYRAVAGHYIINYEVAKVLCKHSMNENEFQGSE